MKNPSKIFLSDKVKGGEAELVKCTGFICYVDVSDPQKVRICFKSDTMDKDSALVNVNAWNRENGPDWTKILSDAKGRYAVAICTKTITNKDGKTYDNLNLDSIDFAPKQS